MMGILHTIMHRQHAKRPKWNRTRHETGATATEYALLAAFIAAVLVAGVALFGTNLNLLYNDLGTALDAIF